jgi:NAD(P)H-binding
VVAELIGAGHQVVGLARSDSSAEAVSNAGAEPYRGSLHDPETLRNAAENADGVIHLAFKHDFNDFLSGAAPPELPRHSEAAALGRLTDRGVRTAVVRLPPSVHGEGDHGFVPRLIQVARENGVAAYVGDGANRWPTVHRFDAASGRHTNLPVRSVAPDDVLDHFGWIGPLFAADAPGTSTLTRDLLGWHPKRENLLDDLDAGHYFAAAVRRRARWAI